MLVFDTETDGLWENMSTNLEKQPSIIEFCGTDIDIKKGKIYIQNTYNQLIKPPKPITEEITKMNGITNAMVAKSPSFKMVATDLRDLIERSDCVVAHNAAFDVGMMDIEMMRLGVTKVAWPRIICTVEATIFITGYRMTLSSLYEYLFKEKFEGAHRAAADVGALCRIVVELTKRGIL